MKVGGLLAGTHQLGIASPHRVKPLHRYITRELNEQSSYFLHFVFKQIFHFCSKQINAIILLTYNNLFLPWWIQYICPHICVGRLSWWCCSTRLNITHIRIDYTLIWKASCLHYTRYIRTNFANEASELNQFVSIRSTVKMLRKLLVLSILIAFCANCNSYYYNGRNVTARANVAVPPPYNGYRQPPVWNTLIKQNICTWNLQTTSRKFINNFVLCVRIFHFQSNTQIYHGRYPNGTAYAFQTIYQGGVRRNVTIY